MSPPVPNYTRRRFLTGTATLGAGVAMSPLLAACTSDDAASPEPTASTSSTTTSTSTTTPPTSTTAPATTEPAQTFERFAHGSPGTPPEPAAIVRSNWSNDPFSMGAYSHQSDSHRAALAEPVAGRVLFAGEHTSYNRWATVDGAMRSGIREAMRLLDEPDVPLIEITS